VGKDNDVKYGCKDGIGLGVLFAAIISWSLNHSFWWMLLHAFLGWFYVFYWAIWL
jgi:hypothetical protein